MSQEARRFKVGDTIRVERIQGPPIIGLVTDVTRSTGVILVREAPHVHSSWDPAQVETRLVSRENWIDPNEWPEFVRERFADSEERSSVLSLSTANCVDLIAWTAFVWWMSSACVWWEITEEPELVAVMLPREIVAHVANLWTDMTPSRSVVVGACRAALEE